MCSHAALWGAQRKGSEVVRIPTFYCSITFGFLSKMLFRLSPLKRPLDPRKVLYHQGLEHTDIRVWVLCLDPALLPKAPSLQDLHTHPAQTSLLAVITGCSSGQTHRNQPPPPTPISGHALGKKGLITPGFHPLHCKSTT